jgi:hypothetical protein
MPDIRRSSTDGDDFATLDLIREARRPILIARHREMVSAMERSLSEQSIREQAEHRLDEANRKELAAESEVERALQILTQLSEDEHFRDMSLQQALTDYLCLLREDGNLELAALQLHAIGIYRQVRERLLTRQTGEPPLAELREITTAGLGVLLAPPTPVFGRIGVPQVYTRSFVEQTLKEARRLMRGDREGVTWTDEDQAAAVTREDEEQVRNLPASEREAALQFLVRDRIRSRFYRSVFLEYLEVDEFDPIELGNHRSVLGWLQVLAETPHLFPFLQGQPDTQKAFRIARLTQKLVQLFEIYARVARAEGDPHHHSALAKLTTTREKLSYLMKSREPPIPTGPDLTLSTLLCPFPIFVAFVQTRVQAGDFILPPDPKP